MIVNYTGKKTYKVNTTEEELNALCKAIEERLDLARITDAEANMLTNIHVSILRGLR